VLRAGAALLVALAVAACAPAEGPVAFTGEPRPADRPHHIVELLAADERQRFDTLIGLVIAHDEAPGARVQIAEDLLTGMGPITLFAPTDDAFARLPANALEALNVRRTTVEGEQRFVVQGDPDPLLEVLARHVVLRDVAFDAPAYVEDGLIDGRVPLADAGFVLVENTARLPTVGGPTMEVGRDVVRVNGATARIVERDVEAPNGFVQVIDTVLT
jgi:uncharacterized surface protein with fasciclin (FAS1) repeats